MTDTRFPDLTSLVHYFGASHISWILAQPHPAEAAHSRAVGAWDANLLEQLDAYTQLERYIRAGTIKSSTFAGIVIDYVEP